MSYIDTKNRGIIESPENNVNLFLYKFLELHIKEFDGSRFYDDLIDIYEVQESLLRKRVSE